MKYIVSLAFILIAIVLVTVALQNSQEMNVVLTPDWLPLIGGFNYTAPLFVTIYIALFSGVGLGLFFEYLRETRIRSRGRKAQRELKKTQKQLEKTKSDAGQSDDDVLALVN